MVKNLTLAVLSVLSLLALWRCGSSGHGGGGGAPATATSALETTFDDAAAKYKIPKRLLVAVGFQASNLNAKSASAPYFQIEGDATKRSLGFPVTETAFGLTRKSLGLKSDASGDALSTQIDAYAKWLSKHLEGTRGLKADAAAPNDVFLWLWEISRVQIATDRNVRSIWVRDMINLLNAAKFGKTLSLEIAWTLRHRILKSPTLH